MLAGLASAYAGLGDRASARRIYTELLARENIEYIQPATLAGVAASAGLDSEALAWAQVATEQCDPTLVWSRVMPGWSALRQVPGFEAVYARLSLRARASPSR
jgi:hypothetical protein